MTKRDFFIIAIKLFGLYILINSLFSIFPGSISMLFYDPYPTLTISWVIGITLIVFGLFILLVYKADKIVDLFKLDQKFDEDRIVLTNIKPENVIKLGTFIIGGVTFLQYLPSFLTNTYYAFQAEVSGVNFLVFEDKFVWAQSAINLIIGYLLMTNFNVVAKWFGAKENDDKER